MDFNINNVIWKVKKSIPIVASDVLNLAKIEENDTIETACVSQDKVIKYNKKFMERLTLNQQAFVISHEICHVAFLDFSRWKKVFKNLTEDEKKNVKFYMELWNVATDTCINAILKESGLEIPIIIEDNVVKFKPIDDDTGSLKSSEEIFWELKNMCDRDQNFKNQMMKNSGNSQFDSHDNWYEQNTDKNLQESSTDDKNSENDRMDERKVYQDVVKSKKDKKKVTEESLSDLLKKKLPEVDFPKSKYEFNWKKYIRAKIEVEKTYYGDRRHIGKTRIYTREVEGKRRIEVILDTSGSISLEFLKTFLQELLEIIKIDNVSLYVKNFADKCSDDFILIKDMEDIKNYNPRIGGGTNFQAAIDGFSNKRNTVRFVFTDGGAYDLNFSVKYGINWLFFDGYKEKKVSKYIERGGNKVIRYSISDEIYNISNTGRARG